MRSSTSWTPGRSAVLRTTRSPRTTAPTRLAGRGILYAPDFVVNAGGVIYLDLEAKKLGTKAEIMERVAAIGDTVRRVFDEAEHRGITPLEAAEELAAERLDAGRHGARALA